LNDKKESGLEKIGEKIILNRRKGCSLALKVKQPCKLEEEEEGWCGRGSMGEGWKCKSEVACS